MIESLKSVEQKKMRKKENELDKMRFEKLLSYFRNLGAFYFSKEFYKKFVKIFKKCYNRKHRWCIILVYTPVMRVGLKIYYRVLSVEVSQRTAHYAQFCVVLRSKGIRIACNGIYVIPASVETYSFYSRIGKPIGFCIWW